MESRKIKLLDDPEIMTSLKSILYEYTETGKIKIYGAYSHIVEGLIRACWGNKRQKFKSLLILNRKWHMREFLLQVMKS